MKHRGLLTNVFPNSYIIHAAIVAGYSQSLGDGLCWPRSLLIVNKAFSYSKYQPGRGKLRGDFISGMLQVVSAVSGETILSLEAAGFQSMSVRDLKKSLELQTGCSRFCQKLLRDHSPLADDDPLSPLTDETLHLLLMQFLPPDEKDAELMSACRICPPEMVEAILRQPRDPNVMSKGRTALHYVARGKYGGPNCRLLLEAWADANTRADDGNTPLHDAAALGNLEVAHILLKSGADKDARTASGLTPLHAAAKAGSLDVLRLLVDFGANHKAVTDSGQTPLHQASVLGREKCAHFLLDCKADIEAATSAGRRPLHLVAAGNMPSLVRLLLKTGADKDAKSGGGRAPLHEAARFGHIKVVKTLVEFSADIQVVTNSGTTPLYEAAASGHRSRIEVARFLFASSADLEATTEKGMTALHVAAVKDDPEMVQFLVASGANIDATTEDGETLVELAGKRVTKCLRKRQM